MSDRFRIDSHKLIYHPERVADWIRGRLDWEKAKSVYPIYIEMSPFGACNHRCLFCAVDFVGYQSRKFDEAVMRDRLTEMARLGVKSIMFAGEGEPTLWKPLPEILDHCTDVGIDTSLTTNMVPFSADNTESFVRNCAWIKTSVNAGTAETYSQIHRTKPADFDRVMENFARAVDIRKQKGYKCTIGAQMLLLPENAHEAATLARRLKAIGIDYLVVKPYSQHHSSVTRQYEGIEYGKYQKLSEELGAVSGDGFNVVFRARTMAKLKEDRRAYDTCYSTPFFWAYVMADGSVYTCSAFLCDERFMIGNLNEYSFKEIWEGERRRKCLEMMATLPIDECRTNCRMDEVNRYLWELAHPGPHVNFI